MNEEQKISWSRLVAKLGEYIKLAIPPAAQNAVKVEIQHDVTTIERLLKQVADQPQNVAGDGDGITGKKISKTVIE